MGLVLTDFQGELPGVSDFNKPASAASIALNVLTQGSLVPWSFASSDVRTLAKIRRKAPAFRHGEVQQRHIVAACE